MIDVGFTKMSSKGQVVIPQEMRKDLPAGEKFIIIRKEKDLILKPASSLEKSFMEDINFAKRTEAALERYKKGKHKEMTEAEFLKKLEDM